MIKEVEFDVKKKNIDLTISELRYELFGECDKANTNDNGINITFNKNGSVSQCGLVQNILK